MHRFQGGIQAYEFLIYPQPVVCFPNEDGTQLVEVDCSGYYGDLENKVDEVFGPCFPSHLFTRTPI